MYEDQLKQTINDFKDSMRDLSPYLSESRQATRDKRVGVTNFAGKDEKISNRRKPF